jgi:hypothetical protein
MLTSQLWQIESSPDRTVNDCIHLLQACASSIAKETTYTSTAVLGYFDLGTVAGKRNHLLPLT